MANTLLVVLGWLATVVVAMLASVAVDAVAVGVLFRYLPPAWDLTGHYFTLTVPLASALVVLPVLGIGSFLGLGRLPKLVTFYVVMAATTTAMLASLSNPPWDIARYLMWITCWWVLAVAAVRPWRK